MSTEEAKAAAKRWEDECIQDLTAPWLGNTYPTYDDYLFSEKTLPSNPAIPQTPTPRPRPAPVGPSVMASKPKGPPPIDPNRPLLFQPLQTLSQESWGFYEALEKQQEMDNVPTVPMRKR